MYLYEITCIYLPHGFLNEDEGSILLHLSTTKQANSSLQSLVILAFTHATQVSSLYYTLQFTPVSSFRPAYLNPHHKVQQRFPQLQEPILLRKGKEVDRIAGLYLLARGNCQIFRNSQAVLKHRHY